MNTEEAAKAFLADEGLASRFEAEAREMVGTERFIEYRFRSRTGSQTASVRVALPGCACTVSISEAAVADVPGGGVGARALPASARGIASRHGRGWLARLCAPRMNRWFVPRLLSVALCAYGFFGHVCIPAVANGYSMEPTYHNGAFLFCWIPKTWFGELRRGDVVMLRMAGTKVMLLKRVVAFAGETVTFRDGKLLIDGKPLDEPYVRTTCNWNLPPSLVPNGQVYVVGDNRGMPQEQHMFGKTDRARIVGSPLW